MSTIRPNKRLGQHFLHDENYLEKIVAAAALSPADPCLEIGAGTGSLTKHLVKKSKHVVAVEIDPALIPLLRANVPAPITIIQKDFLDLDLGKTTGTQPGKWKVVANLPYQITSPVIFKLLDNLRLYKGIFLLIQKEVAERIIASPGTKTYGTVSIFCQIQAECRIVFRVPRVVFTPPPDVESALLEMLPRQSPLHDTGDRNVFRAVVRGAFEHRRKTCYNSLLIAFTKGKCRDLLPQGAAPEKLVKSALEHCAILPNQRPETITIEEFAALSRFITEKQRVKTEKKQ